MTEGFGLTEASRLRGGQRIRSVIKVEEDGTSQEFSSKQEIPEPQLDVHPNQHEYLSIPFGFDKALLAVFRQMKDSPWLTEADRSMLDRFSKAIEGVPYKEQEAVELPVLLDLSLPSESTTADPETKADPERKEEPQDEETCMIEIPGFTEEEQEIVRSLTPILLKNGEPFSFDGKTSVTGSRLSVDLLLEPEVTKETTSQWILRLSSGSDEGLPFKEQALTLMLNDEIASARLTVESHDDHRVVFDSHDDLRSIKIDTVLL